MVHAYKSLINFVGLVDFEPDDDSSGTVVGAVLKFNLSTSFSYILLVDTDLIYPEKPRFVFESQPKQDVSTIFYDANRLVVRSDVLVEALTIPRIRYSLIVWALMQQLGSYVDDDSVSIGFRRV
jgi:hypothetical protein